MIRIVGCGRTLRDETVECRSYSDESGISSKICVPAIEGTPQTLSDAPDDAVPTLGLTRTGIGEGVNIRNERC